MALSDPVSVIYYALQDSGTPDVHGCANKNYADGVELDAEVEWEYFMRRLEEASWGEALTSQVKVRFELSDLDTSSLEPGNGDLIGLPGPFDDKKMMIIETRPVDTTAGEYIYLDCHLACRGILESDSG